VPSIGRSRACGRELGGPGSVGRGPPRASTQLPSPGVSEGLRLRCGVVVRPFAALADGGSAMTSCDQRFRDAWSAGGGTPRIPPSYSGAFPQVTALDNSLGEVAALAVIHIRPGQALLLDKVELGGIEPLRGCVRRTCAGAIAPGQSAFSSVLQ
jgi:hypothetical protein